MIKVGDKVKLKEEYLSGSNRIDFEWAIVEKVFSDYIMPEVWLVTDKGVKIIEYIDYLELYGTD